jgi:hypothetical protein
VFINAAEQRIEDTMKRQLIQTLVVGSFAAMAYSASAQYPSRPGTTQPPANPSATTPQPSSGTMTSPSGTNSMNLRGRMTDDQIREYTNARTACASQPASQQEACNADLNKKFNSVDAKCQKLNGQALTDCLHGG